MKAKILAMYYADAGAFVTKEEGRYSLDTLRIEPHPERGVVIVATDGHTMGVFHDLGGECPGDGITLRYNASLADMCAPERMLEINDDGSASVLNRDREEVRFSAIETDTNFPAWRAVLPAWTREVTRTDYNPDYIDRCAKLSRSPYPHLALWHGVPLPQPSRAEEGPSVVRLYERDDCFFLIMPMRKNESACWPELLDAVHTKDHKLTEETTEV